MTTRADYYLRRDLRELRLNLSNIWFELRPVVTTKARVERSREVADQAGFERGRKFQQTREAEQ